MEKCLSAFERGFCVCQCWRDHPSRCRRAGSSSSPALFSAAALAAPLPTLCFPNDSIDSMSICCLLHHKLQLPPLKCDLRMHVWVGGGVEMCFGRKSPESMCNECLKNKRCAVEEIEGVSYVAVKFWNLFCLLDWAFSFNVGSNKTTNWNRQTSCSYLLDTH